jgi:hypothetical protein
MSNDYSSESSITTEESICVTEEVLKSIAARNLLYLHYHTSSMKICQLCGVNKTPLWRKNHMYHTLCNACGIREKTRKINKL